MSQLQRKSSASASADVRVDVSDRVPGVARSERAGLHAGESESQPDVGASRRGRRAAGEIQVLPVQGNVHVLIGAGANITVQAGDDGVLMVDTGNAAMSAKVIAAMRSISSQSAALHRQHDGPRRPHRRQRSDCGYRRDDSVPRTELHGRSAGRPRRRPRVDHFVLHGDAPHVGAHREGGADSRSRVARQHLLDRAEAALLQR